ncbi:MAG: choice-of-anchor D domain-containing protein [Cellulomonadaceae bacterium]|nr:choice-of-anchor D domain-containing protein [Cellulomonadaceae bacterium]
MTDDQAANNGNKGESERRPEQLRERQVDRTGATDNRRWRYGVRDTDALGFVGAGMWRQVGPAPMVVGNEQIFQGVGPDSGEVVDIAVDPRGGPDLTLYAASGSGGVWKSTDDGATWRCVTDQLPTTSIGAIALDPVNPDIVYVATGNLFDGASGMARSTGLFKSIDAGRTWWRLTSPAGRPPQAITAAVNVPGGVRVTVAGHGYSTFDRVAAVGLPGVLGAANESVVLRIDGDTLRIAGVTMTGAYGGGGTLFDARQPPFLSDNGVIRMVCPAGGALLVASQTGLYYSADGGRSFGANHPRFDDGKPVRTGVISALEIDQGWMRPQRVVDATPASPIVVTLPKHGFVAGDHVMLGGVTTNREANGGWVVDVPDADHISLRGSSGNGTGAVTGFAIGPAHPSTRPVTGATNPVAPAPVVLTCAAHGFVTGDVVAVSGVQGTTGANGSFPVRVLSPDTFALVGSRGNGAYVAGGVVDGPRHPAPRPVTAAVNAGGGVTATIVGHGLVDGDRVSVLGLPGIAAPGNSASVRRVDDDHVRLAGLTMNAVYGGAGATVVGPADQWRTAYFVCGGRVFGTTTLNPDRGLFRLTITSTGELVLSDNLLSHPGGVAGGFGRVAFSQSLLPRTRTLFASVQDNEAVGAGIYVGLFRSDDFGATWTVRPGLAPRVNVDGGGQTAYDLVIAVDPQDARRVYAAQQQLWRSIDGGTTWPTVTPATRGGVDQLGTIGRSPSTTLLHWDHHELVFPPATRWTWDGGAPANPVTPTPAYHGTDGGIARSGTTPAGVMTFTALNEGIATSLLMDIDIGRGAGRNAVTFGGMQDTGTAGHRRGDAARTWFAGIDGDGGTVAVDPADPDIVFGMDGGNFTRSTDGGATWFIAGIPRTVPIQSVANTNPVRVVTAGHSYRTGDVVTVAGVTGGGGLANGACAITVVDARTFTLNGKNGTAVAAFGAGPRVTGDRYLGRTDVVAATLQAPIQVETATPHGCATGQRVRIDAVEGNVAANNDAARPSWTVTVISPTRLSLDGSDGSLSRPYVSGTGRLRGPATNATMPVFGTVNAPQLVVTAQGHGFVSGDVVTVAGVLGNTNANVAGTAIRVLDENSFELVGVAGNAAPGGLPRVFGPNVGRGLPGGAYMQKIALVPNGGAPATTVFVSMDRVLFRSTNGGISFVPMATFADFITALSAPAANRLWLATGGLFGGARTYRVRFSSTGGTSFTVPNFVSDVGARSYISEIIEDPAVAGGTHVAVVAAGYSRTATERRTRHVFVTTTGGIRVGAGSPWTEVGGTFNALTGNLPDLPVTSAGWDTTGPPGTASALLVGTDNGVLRLDPAGPTWHRVGPNLPHVSVQAIAIDPTPTNPAVVRIGTYGRSAWELVVPPGPSLVIESDLGFGDLQVGTTVRRPLVLHSVGAVPVHVTGISGATADMTVESRPPGAAFPITLASGEHRTFDVVFAPSATGNRGAFLMVTSDDPDHLAVEVKATGFGIAAGAPRLAARAFLEFGTVRSGSPGDLPLEIRNIGDAPLNVDTLALDAAGSPRFTLVAPPAVPFTIQPGGSRTVTVRFDPIANGPLLGSLVIRGSGQGQVVNLVGQGTTTATGMVAVLLELLGVSDPPEAVA